MTIIQAIAGMSLPSKDKTSTNKSNQNEYAERLSRTLEIFQLLPNRITTVEAKIMGA